MEDDHDGRTRHRAVPSVSESRAAIVERLHNKQPRGGTFPDALMLFTEFTDPAAIKGGFMIVAAARVVNMGSTYDIVVDHSATPAVPDGTHEVPFYAVPVLTLPDVSDEDVLDLVLEHDLVTKDRMCFLDRGRPYLDFVMTDVERGVAPHHVQYVLGSHEVIFGTGDPEAGILWRVTTEPFRVYAHARGRPCPFYRCPTTPRRSDDRPKKAARLCARESFCYPWSWCQAGRLAIR